MSKKKRTLSQILFASLCALCILIIIYINYADKILSSSLHYEINRSLMPSDVNIYNNAAIKHNQSNNRSWLQLYNITKLDEDLQSTFKNYASRPDRIELSKQIRFRISINNSVILFIPQFKEIRVGPLLCLYWQARMISFFSRFYKFKVHLLGDPSAIIKRRYDIFVNRAHFMSYLPRETNIHAIDINYDKYAAYQDWIIYWILKSDMGGLYSYGADHMDLMQSKVFTNIIRYETNIAFTKYYFNMNKLNQQNLIENRMWINKKDDVLIHIRCQDILLNGAKSYGMSSLHYFVNAINNIFNITLHDNMAIHIVFFLGGIVGRDRSAHPEWPDNGCDPYLNNYIKPAFKKLFNPAQIIFITDGSIDDDFYRFVKAPNLICGTSSYCLMAAFANYNNVVLYKGWVPQSWSHFQGYQAFQTVADNLYYLEDPYFVGCGTIKKEKWSVDRIGHETMVIDGRYVLDK